jgi:hypothetical protein
MNLQGLIYHCHDCTEWFTKKTIPHTEYAELEEEDKYIRQIHTCHCGGEVSDAHETHTVTPYEELQLEMLQDQVDVYENQIDLLKRRMTNIDGENR